jgi:hypothetical protein
LHDHLQRLHLAATDVPARELRARSPRSSYGPTVRIVLRVVVALLFAVWWGGFTFYAAVVVPIGVQVLGSATAQGFVTQPVSDRLNVLGAVVIALLCWNMIAARRDSSPRLRRILVISWTVLAAAQLALFVLHTRLDGMLDLTTRSIAADHAVFYTAHRVYLLVATAQWLAAIVHAIAVGLAVVRSLRPQLVRS